MKRIGLSIFLIAILLLLAANAYIWRIQEGVYEYSIAVYLAGVITPVGIVGVLMAVNRSERKE